MSASIEFSDVSFHYGFRHSDALENVSFSVGTGSITGTAGPKRIGKIHYRHADGRTGSPARGRRSH